jgi:hypothetical protein
MSKIIFYTQTILSVLIGFPIALLLIIGFFIHDIYNKLTCKNNCKL